MAKSLSLIFLFLIVVTGTVQTFKYFKKNKVAIDSLLKTEKVETMNPIKVTQNQPAGVLNPGGTKERARVIACSANIVNLNNYIMHFKAINPSKTVTVEYLKKSGMALPKCQSGGTYKLQNGKFVCSYHSIDAKNE